MKNTKFVLVVLCCWALSGGTRGAESQEIQLPDGSIYRGGLADGLLSGQGVLEWPNGDSYQGDFAQGVINGQGRLSLASGDVYEGEFVDGQLQGQGRWQGEDGSQYQGEFQQHQFHGEGVYQSVDGDIYRGQFVEGDLTGLGTYQSADGITYAGEFLSWRYHGAGIWQDDGQRYTGEFEEGYFHGYGELVDLATGEVLQAGRWRWGRLVPGKATQRKREQARVKLEQALFEQTAIVERALNTLVASEPGVSDIYAVLIAGDGTQSVFDKEVRTISRQLQNRYIDPARQVVLSNHPDSVAEFPLATRSNIQTVLLHLRELMQPEEDLLLLYMTSHGSEDHAFSMEAPGFDFVDVRPVDLAEALEPLRLTPKVLMISACYSGGYIEPLKAPQHLVMTAARADRTSFGCGDSDTMTYFGRAYFEQALPEAENFVEAFHLAKAQIYRWEDEQEFEHSEPQIYVGDVIERVLSAL